MTVSINGRYSHNFIQGVLVKETLSPANETVNRGHYAATTLSTVDAELATANIKNGITIFGFAGDADVHDISDATAVEAEVLDTETFYAVGGGIRTGTMPTVAITAVNDDYLAGYHAGDVGGLSAIDVNLAAANIKSGINIFGFTGPATVQEIGAADAVLADVKAGKTFFSVTGGIKTGNLATVALDPANENVPAGYYAATTLSAVDIHLAAANIKQGVTIFGFLGTLVGVPNATLADFQLNPATGTFLHDPENINDNNTGSVAYPDGINQYAEVDFGQKVLINQWRQYGSVVNNADGVWKIQYKNSLAAWVDWVTGIPTRGASWSGMTVELEVVTQYIRLVCTTVDSGSGGESWIGELEVYHD